MPDSRRALASARWMITGGVSTVITFPRNSRGPGSPRRSTRACARARALAPASITVVFRVPTRSCEASGGGASASATSSGATPRCSAVRAASTASTPRTAVAIAAKVSTPSATPRMIIRPNDPDSSPMTMKNAA